MSLVCLLREKSFPSVVLRIPLREIGADTSGSLRTGQVMATKTLQAEVNRPGLFSQLSSTGVYLINQCLMPFHPHRSCIYPAASLPSRAEDPPAPRPFSTIPAIICYRHSLSHWRTPAATDVRSNPPTLPAGLEALADLAGRCRRYGLCGLALLPRPSRP